MTRTADRNAFLLHLAAYVAVNAGLAALNLTQTSPADEARELWFIWPLMGWGIGIAAHGFALWAQARAREGGMLADPDVRGVAVHLFVYLAVNALLVAVNLSTSPGTLWSIWPILGWGVGLAAHAWLAYRTVTRRTVERYATEQRILSEIQIEQQASKIAQAIAEAQDAAKKAVTPPGRRKQAGSKGKKKAAARKGSGAGTKRKAAAKPAGTPKSKTRKSPAKGKSAKPAAKKPAGRGRKPATSNTSKTT